MDNQLVSDQNSQQVVQNSTNQTAITSVKQSKVNYWMLSTIVLLSLIVVGLLTNSFSSKDPD
jgi:Na+/proline symporter